MNDVDVGICGSCGSREVFSLMVGGGARRDLLGGVAKNEALMRKVGISNGDIGLRPMGGFFSTCGCP